MSTFFKATIVLFSEVTWLYYLFFILASIEIKDAFTISPFWWGMAAFAGYGMNVFLVRFSPIFITVLCNIGVLSFILFQNWKEIDGSILLSLFITAGLLFVFCRSTYYVFKETTRKVMMYRFEGNLIFYALFALVLLPNDWVGASFHFVFLIAIVLSLIGMIMSLQRGQEEKQYGVEVFKVGQAGWFISVIIGLFLGVATISSMLFLPGFKTALSQIGTTSFHFLTSIVQYFFQFIGWLIRLIPSSNESGQMPPPTPSPELPLGELEEQIGISIPIEWIIGIVLVLVLLFLTFFFTKFLKTWKRPNRHEHHSFVMTRELSWRLLYRKIAAMLKKMNVKWRSHFVRYYKHPIFWYFHQVERWGRKNGVKRSASETVNEYIEKVILIVRNDEKKEIVSLLRQLSKDYEAAYYGNVLDRKEEQYTHLLGELKQVNVKKK